MKSCASHPAFHRQGKSIGVVEAERAAEYLCSIATFSDRSRTRRRPRPFKFRKITKSESLSRYQQRRPGAERPLHQIRVWCVRTPRTHGASSPSFVSRSSPAWSSGGKSEVRGATRSRRLPGRKDQGACEWRKRRSASHHLAGKPVRSGRQQLVGVPCAGPHPCKFPRSMDNRRSVLFPYSVELFEIGDDIVDLLRILQPREDHFGAGDLGLGVLDIFAESSFIPGESGILVCGLVAEALNRTGPSPEQPVEHRANGVPGVLTNLVTRLALEKDLLAGSCILGISGGCDEESGSKHENETAHPTISMAAKQHGGANRATTSRMWLQPASSRNDTAESMSLARRTGPG